MVENKGRFSYIKEKNYFNEEMQEFFENNFSAMIEEVNNLLKINKKQLVRDISKKVYDCLTTDNYILKYEWYYDDCPYDYSGKIEPADYINSCDVSLKDFLFSYYTGDSEATYTSHYGLHWITYSDYFSSGTLDYAYSCMMDIITKYAIMFDLNLEKVGDIRDLDWCDYILDDLYSESDAYNYFHIEEENPILDDKYLNMSVFDFSKLWDT